MSTLSTTITNSVNLNGRTYASPFTITLTGEIDYSAQEFQIA